MDESLSKSLPEFYIPSLKLGTNIAPENGWLEEILVSLWDGLFSGAMLVLGRVIQIKSVKTPCKTPPTIMAS